MGELGAALSHYDASIAVFEKNDDTFAVRSFQIHRSALLFHVLPFQGAVQSCLPVLSQGEYCNGNRASGGTTVPPPERRIALIYCGLAEMGLGNIASALHRLHSAEEEMARHPAHLDWYWRLALEWGVVNILIAERNPAAAAVRAEQLSNLAAQTDERTWQALAWEACARGVVARRNIGRD